MVSEDTLKSPEAAANEALIAEMLRGAQKAELPSDLKENPIIHKGDAELPAPMVVQTMDSAGYYYIWDTRTHKKIPVLYYMLQKKLRQRRPDGSFRFTVHDPGPDPKRGRIKCLLHPDNENRKHYDELGFKVCLKDNITNPYELRRHMALRHSAIWAAIEEEKKEKERQEDRALQRLLLEQATAKGPAPTYEAPIVVPKYENPTVTTVLGGEKTEQVMHLEKLVAEAKEQPKVKEFFCPTCGKNFKYSKPFKKHLKVCK